MERFSLAQLFARFSLSLCIYRVCLILIWFTNTTRIAQLLLLISVQKASFYQHTLWYQFFQNGVVTFCLISFRFFLIYESYSEKLTANIKLTMMSIYLAHRIPEFNSNSRFAILLLLYSFDWRFSFVLCWNALIILS